MLQRKDADLTSIQPASFNDIKQILEIQSECNLSVWTEDGYRQEIKNNYSFIYVAKTNGKVYGFIASRFLAESMPEPIEEKTEEKSEEKTNVNYLEAEILNFGVSQNCRRRGIGSLLLKEFIRKADDLSVEAVWLEVRVSNFRAIKFYTGKGFFEIGRKKNFYRCPPDDAIVMKHIMTASSDL